MYVYVHVYVYLCHLMWRICSRSHILVKSVLLRGCAWGDSGHVLHYACCRDKISGSWPGPAISFAFLNCPICALRMSHPALQAQLESVASLHKDLEVFLVFEGHVSLCMCPTIYT